ncbi:unnamed protein product [Linum trigynum]|uniref:Uncharacterized protein n=1 Tax=Linum trigynum TaxID=586398 RepID=A0AAV2FCC6_9ROSI
MIKQRVTLASVSPLSSHLTYCSFLYIFEPSLTKADRESAKRVKGTGGVGGLVRDFEVYGNMGLSGEVVDLFQTVGTWHGFVVRLVVKLLEIRKGRLGIGQRQGYGKRTDQERG